MEAGPWCSVLAIDRVRERRGEKGRFKLHARLTDARRPTSVSDQGEHRQPVKCRRAHTLTRLFMKTDQRNGQKMMWLECKGHRCF